MDCRLFLPGGLTAELTGAPQGWSVSESLRMRPVERIVRRQNNIIADSFASTHMQEEAKGTLQET